MNENNLLSYFFPFFFSIFLFLFIGNDLENSESLSIKKVINRDHYMSNLVKIKLREDSLNEARITAGLI